MKKTGRTVPFNVASGQSTWLIEKAPHYSKDKNHSEDLGDELLAVYSEDTHLEHANQKRITSIYLTISVERRVLRGFAFPETGSLVSGW